MLLFKMFTKSYDFQSKQKLTRFKCHKKLINIGSIKVSLMFSNNYWFIICIYLIIFVD